MTVVVDNRIGSAWIKGDVYDADLNPSDLRITVARVSVASAADAVQAMTHAARALAGWRTSPVPAREHVLRAAAALLRQRRAEIARDIAAEVGKTMDEASTEVAKSADFFDYYAGLLRLPYGDLLPDARPATTTVSLREPLGVILVITPWNDPMLTPARKIAPALSVGNTVVLKPARDSPLAAAHLVRALIDAGLPDGAINLVNGEGAVVAPPMLGHPALAALSFTGSTTVGYTLQHALAGRPVRVQTELGGKNASAVLADADLDVAVSVLLEASFRQAGQRCTATSRILVEDAIHDEFVARFVEATKRLRLGPATAADTTLGPVVNARHAESVLGHITRAAGDGATVVTGGSRPSDVSLAHGCFIEPTVIIDVRPDMPLWREEVFGPVVAVRRCATFDAAVAAVNDSSYGLAAAVFTRSLETAHRFIADADVGQVAVNLGTAGWDVHFPFGGFKDSGSAFKEQGLAALQFYTRVKTASIRHAA